MSLVNVTNIIIDNNPSPFLSNLKLHITFECLREINDEIEWKFVYIGSAKDEKQDQLLDSFSMGPLQSGIMQFTLESNPPDYTRIPSKDDLLGVTAIILSVSFRKQEFFRVGYYVYNSYIDPELIENDPPEVLIDRVQRNILADKPRITRFNINWGDDEQKLMEQQVVSDVLLDMTNNATQMNSMMQLPDPFAKSNGIFEQLDHIPSLGSGMFGPQVQVPTLGNNQYIGQTMNNPQQDAMCSEQMMQGHMNGGMMQGQMNGGMMQQPQQQNQQNMYFNGMMKPSNDGFFMNQYQQPSVFQ